VEWNVKVSSVVTVFGVLFYAEWNIEAPTVGTVFGIPFQIPYLSSLSPLDDSKYPR
jgi:hypothetical protein